MNDRIIVRSVIAVIAIEDLLLIDLVRIIMAPSVGMATPQSGKIREGSTPQRCTIFYVA
jgi:hypothetical protein